MHPVEQRMHMEFFIPTRGLFGYKTEFMTDTKGEGIMGSVFERYEPQKGEITKRFTGSLIAYEEGECTSYGIYNAQDRGPMFVSPAEKVYGGMVVGISSKGDDIVVNVCKKKHLTNTRASGSDDALRLISPRVFSLEECLEFIADDELLEVTPKSLRIRKRILSKELRMKAKFRVEKED